MAKKEALKVNTQQKSSINDIGLSAQIQSAIESEHSPSASEGQVEDS